MVGFSRQILDNITQNAKKYAAASHINDNLCNIQNKYVSLKYVLSKA
jgi:hypothetical protein